jgi:hypothetical protein
LRAIMRVSTIDRSRRLLTGSVVEHIERNVSAIVRCAVVEEIECEQDSKVEAICMTQEIAL